MKELEKMSQRCANRLVMLYYEMESVKGKFNQDDCECCVIGHGIKSGKMNGYKELTDENFTNAVNWVGLPEKKLDWVCDISFRSYGGYLFGSSYKVAIRAKELSLPNCVGTPKDAQKRIVALLHKAGFNF